MKLFRELSGQFEKINKKERTNKSLFVIYKKFFEDGFSRTNFQGIMKHIYSLNKYYRDNNETVTLKNINMIDYYLENMKYFNLEENESIIYKTELEWLRKRLTDYLAEMEENYIVIDEYKVKKTKYRIG